MHPILFTFPDWFPLLHGKSLHTYGLLVAMGFFFGLSYVLKESRRNGLDPQKASDLFFYIVLSAIIASRVLYVVITVPHWWADPLVFFRIWEGGLVFYGGLIGAVAVSIWYCRKHKLPFLKVADVFIPGVALGHAFGRIGCFAAGCCYGREVSHHHLLGVIFPHTDFSIAPWGVPLFPVQLFESAGEFLIFLFLAWFSRRKKFEGEVFLLYIILYPILRTVMEIFRGDKIRGFVIEGILSTSQFISILWVIVAGLIWMELSRRTKKTHAH